MVIDFSITILLKEKFKIHSYIASSAGFITAASSNYILNRIWTFESANPVILTEYGTFLLVSAVGLIVNNFFLFVFEKRAGFYPAKVLAIGITSCGISLPTITLHLIINLRIPEIAVKHIIKKTCLRTDSDIVFSGCTDLLW